MKARNLFFVSVLVMLSIHTSAVAQTTFGSGPGAATTPAIGNNTNIGSNAGNTNTTDNSANVFVGAFSVKTNFSGSSNTFVGAFSGGNGTTTTTNSQRNSFFGAYAGNRITTGSNNVGIGFQSLFNNTTGSSNVAIGQFAMWANAQASNTIAIGQNAMTSLTAINNDGNIGIGWNAGQNLLTGTSNVFFGRGAGPSLTSGNSNIFCGFQSGQSLTSGSDNVMIGLNSGFNLTSSTRNTLVGFNSGRFLTTGTNNTMIGNAELFSGSSTALIAGNNSSNTVIIADGSNNHRFFAHSNGNVGLGLPANNIPQNRLEINSTPLTPGLVANTMGLRFRGVSNSNFSLTAVSNRRVLSVNTNGDVILVDDSVGGITQNCSTENFIPVNSSTVGQLNCSQISDNGTTVGIGSTGTVSYTSLSGFELGSTLPSSTGDFRLNVEGVVRSLAYFAYSDKRFKKDIKSIENALTTIEKLEGKTYVWNREAFKDKNFDSGGHSGFVAQDLEKVLPHLVATDKDGDKSVNYTELIPYLVEAMKEQNAIIKNQQSQIDELKNQISDNFKAQNNELIQLENTKIISVSPNPSNDLISISLNIEKSVQTASLQVHDLNGKLLNNLTISDRENNISRTLQKDNFGTGVYIVSLIINGKSIDSKKIIFN